MTPKQSRAIGRNVRIIRGHGYTDTSVGVSTCARGDERGVIVAAMSHEVTIRLDTDRVVLAAWHAVEVTD